VTLVDTRPVRELLADDTPELRLLLRRALDLDGSFDVVAEAADGAEAVVLSAGLHPDVVVTDLAMPVIDGRRTGRWFPVRAPPSRRGLSTRRGCQRGPGAAAPACVTAP
jgi:CheY-like chemotaxis protein